MTTTASPTGLLLSDESLSAAEKPKGRKRDKLARPSFMIHVIGLLGMTGGIAMMIIGATTTYSRGGGLMILGMLVFFGSLIAWASLYKGAYDSFLDEEYTRR